MDLVWRLALWHPNWRWRTRTIAPVTAPRPHQVREKPSWASIVNGPNDLIAGNTHANSFTVGFPYTRADGWSLYFRDPPFRGVHGCLQSRCYYVSWALIVLLVQQTMFPGNMTCWSCRISEALDSTKGNAQMSFMKSLFEQQVLGSP